MDINVDTDNFQPPRKRKQSVGTSEVDVKNVEEPKPNKRSVKRKRTTTFSETKDDVRKIPVPAHRYTPLKENWMKIMSPIVNQLNLQIRFNLATRNVEIKACEATTDIGNLQKAADFVKAFVYGFEVDDALALLRLNDLFIDTFEIRDVKTLKGDHQSRAIGRLAGKGGKTKFSIENSTQTRIVLADTKIHILGSHQNIQIARRALCNLILGLPSAKVYGQLKNIASSVSKRM